MNYADAKKGLAAEAKQADRDAEARLKRATDIIAQIGSGLDGELTFQKSSQGKNWFKAEYSIPQTQNHEISIEARGDGYIYLDRFDENGSVCGSANAFSLEDALRALVRLVEG